MIDQHTHTGYSPDADSKTTLLSYISQAKSLGFQGIMLTDHVEFDTPDPLFQKIIDYESYLSAIKDAKSVSGFDIRMGVELGYQSVSIDKMKRLIQSYPFDFVILSTHLIDGEDPYYGAYFKGKSEEESIIKYLETVLESVTRFDDFDVVGHLDHLIRYGPFENRMIPLSLYGTWIDRILNTVIAKGKGIELNTSGIDDITQRMYPSLEILKRYKTLGGTIVTIGSDSHRTSDLGRYFPEAKRLLKEAGFDRIAIYKNRKPTFVLL